MFNKLPDMIIPVGNPDKGFHEHWYNGRNKLNLPHPFRGVLLGLPNVGKTTTIYNIITRARPFFQKVVVVHCNPGYTKEYDIVEKCEIIKDIPPPEDWPGDVKTLCILDDLEFSEMGKDQRRYLKRLYGNVSTHNNVSCLLCAQNFFDVPKTIRECANLWVVWRVKDLDSLNIIARRSGIRKKVFQDIFDKFIKKKKDCLWIDTSDDTPYPLRINGFKNITYKKKKKSIKK